MQFILRGSLYGLICSEHQIPVKNTIVRLYHYKNSDSVVTATNAQEKELFTVLSGDELKEKASDLIAETKTDESGIYQFNLDDKKNKYTGGPVELVIYFPDRPDYGQENKKLPKGFKEFFVFKPWAYT